MNFKVIILDFDGTIIESNGIKDEAFRSIFSQYPGYLEKIMDYHFAHSAVIRFDKFKYITENILHQRYTEAVKNKLSEEFSGFVLKKAIKCLFVEGAREFLDYFKIKVPLYLVSVNPKDDLEKILEAKGIKQYFKKIYAVSGLKENIIEKIIADEKISSRQALFIGDAWEDYLAANAAGTFFIGINSDKIFKNVSVPFFRNLADVKDYLVAEK